MNMDYNQIQLGIIRSIDYKKGVGEITTNIQNFMFTIDNILTEEKLFVGDVVRFRGELVQNVPKAFFVDKVK